jgi:hypothetical protein
MPFVWCSLSCSSSTINALSGRSVALLTSCNAVQDVVTFLSWAAGMLSYHCIPFHIAILPTSCGCGSVPLTNGCFRYLQSLSTMIASSWVRCFKSIHLRDQGPLNMAFCSSVALQTLQWHLPLLA